MGCIGDSSVGAWIFSRDAESGKPIGQLEKSELWKKVLSLKEKDELAK